MEWHAPTIERRKARQIKVGSVLIGGDAPISVQSMTCTDTLDVAATVAQVRSLSDVGADIVRVSVPSMDAAEAFKSIVAQSPVPIVADIHFDYRIAIACAENGAAALRINPGNIGSAVISAQLRRWRRCARRPPLTACQFASASMRAP